MSRVYGYEALKVDACDHLEMIIDTEEAFAPGDSPIEKLLAVAIRTRSLVCASEFPMIVEVDEEEERTLLSQIPGSPMAILRPQASVEFNNDGYSEAWRADFLINASGYLWSGSPIGWRKLIVECDGHNFHERTKEQAARDRSRDRAAILAGYDILRFTGSEIWNDAWGCAAQVLIWVTKGLR